jgi:hypothetical protein
VLSEKSSFWTVRGQFLQPTPAQFLGSDRQAQALVVAKTQPLASQLLAQQAVLFLKIIDDVLLLSVQGKPATVERDRVLDPSCHRSTRIYRTKGEAHQGRAPPVTYSIFKAFGYLDYWIGDSLY